MTALKVVITLFEKYNINEKPFIIIKADSGTYGMGVISIDSIDQIKNLNRKQRNKMLATKGNILLNKVRDNIIKYL